MATFDKIKEVRIRIDDPYGVIEIESVATIEDLPEAPGPYTIYKVESSGAYVTKYEGADSYTTLTLYLSDYRLEQWIDTNGLDYAECRGLQAIAAKVGAEVRIKRIQAGAESTEYQSIMDLYRYYKSVAEDCEKRRSKDSGVNSGRYGSTTQPEIAGGNL